MRSRTTLLLLTGLLGGGVLTACSTPEQPSPTTTLTVSPAEPAPTTTVTVETDATDDRDAFVERLRRGQQRPEDVKFLLLDQSEWDSALEARLGAAELWYGAPLQPWGFVGDALAGRTLQGSWEQRWRLADGTEMIDNIVVLEDEAAAAAAVESWRRRVETTGLPWVGTGKGAESATTMYLAEDAGRPVGCVVQTAGSFLSVVYFVSEIRSPDCSGITPGPTELVYSLVSERTVRLFGGAR